MEFLYPIVLILIVIGLGLYLRKLYPQSISARNAGYQGQIDGLADRIKALEEEK